MSKPTRYNPEIHHRRSIRLPGYDYASPGAYFLTLCLHNREPLFGEIVNGEMHLNLYGKTVKTFWENLERHHERVKLDVFTIMPNHLHGIIELTDVITPKAKSLSEIVRGFKTFSARRINQMRKMRNVPVWQRNYYEHIIRDERALEQIRQYVLENPQRWKEDTENPIFGIKEKDNISRVR
ncbi:transposase [Oscillatoria sp. FACHB-1406]|uniref:transposase n=1 Tax=Oscillatoria sp. FACHB-1406 TaxID=2692846 RepID=UPI0016836BCE|nr:transposase [Oscillatoria sp. FACHB-1406]MBD2577883.1 transposase [Oscillatoria sp. FACHB-1406]